MMKPDEMRDRFAQLQTEIDHIRGLAAPVREAYDAKRNEIMRLEREELRPIVAKMQEIEAPLYDMQQELAMISRALNGRTGRN